MNTNTVKYANRKLYNPATSRYITAKQLLVLFKKNPQVKVISHVNGRDVTRLTLLTAAVNSRAYQSTLFKAMTAPSTSALVGALSTI